MSFSFDEIISTRKTRPHAGRHYLDIKCGNLMQHTIIHCETPYVSQSDWLMSGWSVRDITLRVLASFPGLQSQLTRWKAR